MSDASASFNTLHNARKGPVMQTAESVAYIVGAIADLVTRIMVIAACAKYLGVFNP